VAETLRGLDSGTLPALPQDNSQASFAPPLKKEEGRINWSLTAQQIYNRIRGLQPWPGTFSSFRGKNCAIWGRPLLMPSATVGLAGEILKADSNVVVSCGSATALRLEFVQLEGRKRVTALEFANGARLTRDDRFGD